MRCGTTSHQLRNELQSVLLWLAVFGRQEHAGESIQPTALHELSNNSVGTKVTGDTPERAAGCGRV